MKIYICDAVNGKTTKHFIKWCKENHECVTDMYFNPVYAEWADIIYIEWCETPAIEASRLKGHYDGVYDHEGVWGEREKQYTKDFDWSGKPIYIRAIDMDVYYGHYHSVNWENIAGLFYIAEHIWEMLKDNPYPASLKTALIPLSVNLNDWIFTERTGARHNIAWINHHWSAKGSPLMIQALYELIKFTGDKSWKLHMVQNGRSTEHWLWKYLEHMINIFDLKDNVIFHGSVPDVNEFLDNMEIDYLVSSSLKEAFSLILAEAMAKGIKAVTHSWWGADKIWPPEMIWRTPGEFPHKLIAGQMFDSKHYRELAGRYSHDKEIAKLREAMNI